MPRHMRHLLTIGVGLVAAACASSVRSPSPSREIAAGPACEARRLIADTSRSAELERVSAAADSALAAARSRRQIADTAVYAALQAQLARAVADTALQAQLAQAVADTALQVQLKRAMADTAVQARLDYLTRQSDCPQPESGARGP